jgi:Derlin-2/3
VTGSISGDDGVSSKGPFKASSILLLATRGGASMVDDEEDWSEEDEDDLMFGLDDADDFDMAESDFAEDNTLERMLDAWKKTPPLTKTYLSASFAATLYGYLCNKNEFPSALSLEWKPLVGKLQIWRPLTAFLNFGPLGLGYLMTAHFVWTYMSTLERINHDRPYDFWIMMLFGQLSMVVGYPLLKLSPRFLGHNMSTFLVYIWSRYHEGIEVNMFELFNTRAEMLPWFFLAQTFLLEGELPVLDFLGIVFGHIYHHCKTVGILRAPDSLVNWYNGDSKLAVRIRNEYKPISSDFEMAA